MFFRVIIRYTSVSRRTLSWESSSDTNHKIITEAISRNRFNYIMQNLHCNDNSNLIMNDTFSKIRPFLIHLNEKFIDHGLDESMILDDMV